MLTNINNGSYRYSISLSEPVILCGRNRGALGKCRREPAFDWLFDNYSYPFPLNRNACNFNYSRSKIQTCLLTEQCIHKHNTNYPIAIEKYMHRKITQCKLHASIRPYVHNKYFNWLNMIECFNTWVRVLKRTRDVILSSNIIFNSLQGLHH